MSTSYATLAGRIVDLVGGPANIASFYHCQTRLRFRLRDESRVDHTALDATDGVAKTLTNGGVFQVVVGTHVKDVHDEIQRQLGPIGTASAAGDDEPTEKKGPLGTVLDFITGSFMPIIPALSGAGMVKAFLALLVVTGLTTRESQTYYVLNFFADAIFFFLPVMLAFSAANKLKANPILAAGVACIMVHPNWTALVAAKEPVRLFDFIPLTLTTYSSTVIPIILIILVQAHVEKWLTRIVPKAVNLVFVPMLTFLIMGTIAMSALGPLGSIIGGYLASFFGFLSTNAAWAPAVVIGALLPVMVMFGLHNAVAPLGIVQMSQLGFDSIFGPGAVCSNIAVGVASLVVAVRTKERRLRQIATAGGITGLMGITEPALYGVVLPKRYPLIAAMIGGGAGGLYAGLTQTHRFATGSSGLPAVLLYIGNDTMQYLINIIVALIISATVTALLTFFLALKFEKKAVDAVVDHDVAEALDATLPVVPDHTPRHRDDTPDTATGSTATLVRSDLATFTAPVHRNRRRAGRRRRPGVRVRGHGAGTGGRARRRGDRGAVHRHRHGRHEHRPRVRDPHRRRHRGARPRRNRHRHHARPRLHRGRGAGRPRPRRPDPGHR